MFRTVVLSLVVLFSGNSLCFGQEEIYHPRNLEECFVQLKKNLPKEELEKFKNTQEDEAVSNAHFGVGLWMRNEWIRNRPGKPQLPLGKYFNDLGIYHPDDMSGIILTSFHRSLNNKEIRLEEQIKYYKEYWRKLKESQSKPTQIKSFPGVIFPSSYNLGKIYPSSGRWDPAESDVIEAEKIMAENLKKNEPNIYEKLSSYKRQYFGLIDKNGNKVIWINCFPFSESSGNSEVVIVMDGGDNFFQAEVNLKTKVCSIGVNGEA